MLIKVSDIYIKKVKNRNRHFAMYRCSFCQNISEKLVDNVIYKQPCSCGCRKPLKPLSGEINGIKVIKDLGMNNDNKPKREAIFKCNFCDNEFKAIINAVVTSQKLSCGCLKHKPSTFTHLKTKHPLYRKWSGMKTRCSNKNERCYKNYGGRGISVCKEWNEFLSFYNWAITNGYKKGLTLDRIDVDGNYEPSNCQWISMEENTIKDRTSTFLKRNKSEEICNRYNNEHITISALANEYGTYKEVISSILKNNNIKIENRRLKK